MPYASSFRLLPATVLLAGLLLLPACGNQSDEEIAQLRTSLQSWQAKYDALSSEKTRLDQQAADQKTRADALAAERDDLKGKLAAVQEKIEQLQARMSQLKKAEAPAPPPTPTPSERTAPSGAEVAKVIARLEGVGADLYHAGNYNAVNAVLLSACDLGSKDPLTFYRLAYANATVGRYADAVGWYEKALAALSAQPKPDPALQAQCLSNYGAALAQTGKVPQAIAAYTKALSVEPSYPPPLYNLALLYAANAADKDKAVDALRRYIANGGSRSVSARDMLEHLLPPAPAAPATASTGAPTH